MRKKIWTLIVVMLVGASSALAVEVSEKLTFVKQVSNAAIYTFNYPTQSASGEDVILSSVLMAWHPKDYKEGDQIETVHIYSHYTVTAQKECPTSIGENTTSEQQMVIYTLKRNYGYTSPAPFVGRSIVIAPDYEGYGVSKDVPHPYMASEATARQVVDAVKYGLSLYEKLVAEAGSTALPMSDDWRTFAYGFSQGGAITLAVQRYIEENDLADELRFQGSICGDGPHDLVETLKYYMFDNGDSYNALTEHRKGMLSMTVVFPLILKGMLNADPEMKNYRLEDFFTQQFLDTGIIEWLDSKNYTTGDIDKMWSNQAKNGLTANGRTYTPEQMQEMFYIDAGGSIWGKIEKIVQPEFYEYMSNPDNFAGVPTESGNAFTDMHRALAKNSVAKGWQPLHRIVFFHSRYDMVVPYGNVESFRQEHPTEEGDLYMVIDDDFSSSDHTYAGTAFYINLGLLERMGTQFTWLTEAVPTGIGDIAAERTGISSTGWYTLDGLKLIGKPSRKGIYICNGRKLALH